jgi:penicillin amidase
MAADSIAATVYTAVRRELLAAIRVPDDFGMLDHPSFPTQRDSALWLSFAALLAQVRDRGDWLGRDWTAAVGEALGRASLRLTSTLGPDMSVWTWGRQHQAVFVPVVPGEPALAPRALPGDNETVRSGGLHGMTGMTTSSGSVARYCFDLADWENSGWVVPEQTDEWYDVRLVPMHYAWPAVVEASGPATWLTSSS